MDEQERDYREQLNEPQWETLSGKSIDMQKLLRWGLANATKNEDAQNTTPASELPREPIDPKWIEVILGKSDMQRMKECVETIMNEDINTNEQNVNRAYDELELLIEDIDNTKDFVKSNMWLYLLPKISHSDTRIQCHVLWILGTMVQNNPIVKRAVSSMCEFMCGMLSGKQYMDKGLVPILLDVIDKSPSVQVRSKALYVLSGLLKHNTQGVQALLSGNGLAILMHRLREQDANVQDALCLSFLTKVVFLLSHLVQDNPDQNIADKLVQVCSTCVSDLIRLISASVRESEDLSHKLLELLLLLKSYWSQEEKDQVHRYAKEVKTVFGSDALPGEFLLQGVE